MKRRLFLKIFPSSSLILLRAKQAFGSLLFGVLNLQGNSGSSRELRIYLNASTAVNMPLWLHKNTVYVSISDFAQAIKYRTYFNKKKRKLVVYFPQNQVVLTANNAFVSIDYQVFQMPVTTIWHQNEIYVPLKYFVELLNHRTALKFSYQDSTQTLRINSSEFNINDVFISEKENGTLIRVKTSREFKKEEVTVDMRYGWLHIDFYGGKVDAGRVKKAKTGGLVRKINTFQFKELASVAFQLRREPLSREVVVEPDRKEVLVVLRTKEKISKKEIADLKEEENSPQSDDLTKQLEKERNKWLIDVVVIDPGHGGKDPGTVGAHKTYEKNIVLAIGLKLGEIIKREMPGIKIVYTRKTDRFIELRRRTEIANKNKAKVFISIHANASPKRNIDGFETYFLGVEKGERASAVVLKENSVIKFEDSKSRKQYEGINLILANMLKDDNQRQSEHLASLVQKNLTNEMKSVGMKNRGVKQGPFLVMVRATMPNILVETGFVSNAYDLRILKTAKYQRKIAEGIFRGFKEYKRDYENAI